MPGPVALTGATGFIGNTFLQRLTNAGWQVRALTRHPRNPQKNTIWISGDLDDAVALRELVRDAVAIIHCAGVVRGNSPGQFAKANVRGTINLVEAALERPEPPRFLLISSLAAREPGLSWYAASKYQAEQALAERAGTMPWTIFRPSAVYGPGDREINPLFRAARRGILPLIGGGPARFSLIHVDDLATAALVWLATDLPAGGVYELHDGTPGGYDCDEVARIASEVWGRPVRPLVLPTALAALTAWINLMLSRLCRYAPMLTPGKVRELTHPDWVCDNTPLTAVLPEWRPRIRLRDALYTATHPGDKTNNFHGK
jgi:uncharacterized protein YbjT (DUF2867 family)